MRKTTITLMLLLSLALAIGLVQSCGVPPAKTLEKFFYYEELNPDLFPEGKYPVEGLP